MEKEHSAVMKKIDSAWIPSPALRLTRPVILDNFLIGFILQFPHVETGMTTTAY